MITFHPAIRVMYLEKTISKKSKISCFKIPVADIQNNLWLSYKKDDDLFKGIIKDVFTNSTKSLKNLDALFLKHIAPKILANATSELVKNYISYIL